jgi:DNA-binding NarL/FixJ family response regulator
MPDKIHVAILDDHQSILDGYKYRLGQITEIEVVATGRTSQDLEPMLREHNPDVLLMDVNVPVSPDTPAPFPILNVIPQLLQKHPSLVILVISMHTERTLIKAVMDMGGSGYVLKDDRAAIQNLGSIILSVAHGGIFFSQRIKEQLLSLQDEATLLTARQLEVLSLFAANPELTSAAVALDLNISNSTVRNLLSGAYLRLGVHNRAAAIAKAQHLNLLSS